MVVFCNTSIILSEQDLVTVLVVPFPGIKPRRLSSLYPPFVVAAFFTSIASSSSHTSKPLPRKRSLTLELESACIWAMTFNSAAVGIRQCPLYLDFFALYDFLSNPYHSSIRVSSIAPYSPQSIACSRSGVLVIPVDPLIVLAVIQTVNNS